MTEPIFDETTERVYGALPEHFRRVDPSTEYTMKKYISGICSEMQDVNTLIDRFEYIPPDEGGETEADGSSADTSDLVDARTADESWLTWLSQLLGVSRLNGPPDRQTVINAATGYRSGTADSIAAAAKSALSGTKYAKVYPRSTSAGRNTGGPWDLLLVTRTSETPTQLFAEGIATGNSPVAYNLDIDDTVSKIGPAVTNVVVNPSFETGLHGWEPANLVNRVNLATDPSFEDWIDGAWGSGGGSSVTKDATWSAPESYGTYSIRITPGGTFDYSSAYPSGPVAGTLDRLNLLRGHTYTVSATARLTAPMVSATNAYARAIRVDWEAPDGDGFAVSPTVPNAAGEYRVSVTFTIPVNATEAYYRLFNGSAAVEDVIWWDAVLFEETDEVRPYFDGSNAPNQNMVYGWEGTVNNSPSYERIAGTGIYQVSGGYNSSKSAQVILTGEGSPQGVSYTTPLYPGILEGSTVSTGVAVMIPPGKEIKYTLDTGAGEDPIPPTVVSNEGMDSAWFEVGGDVVLGSDRVVTLLITMETNEPSWFNIDAAFVNFTEDNGQPHPYYFDGDSKYDPDIDGVYNDITYVWFLTPHSGISHRVTAHQDIYELNSVNNSEFANGRALNFNPERIINDFTLESSRYTPFEGGNPLNFMFNYQVYQPRDSQYTTETQVNEDTRSFDVRVVLYDNTDAVVATYTDTVDVTGLMGAPEQFQLYQAMTPAAATKMKFFLDFDKAGTPELPETTFTDNIALMLGMFALRFDDGTDWVLKSANPLEEVIKKGAKPAGYRLWHMPFATNWNTLEATYPTWDDIDGETWTDVEEAGLG